MKKVFIKSLVICVACFMCAGISRIVFGERSSGYGSDTVAESSYDIEYVNEDIYQSTSWSMAPAAYLSLNTSGADVKVVPADGDEIGLDVTVPEGEHIVVRAYVEDEVLIIEIRPNNVTFFGDIDFGTVDWLEDIFHGTSDIKAEISLPQTIYESLKCRLGSGKLSLTEPAARYYDINIGSGNFQMIGNRDFSAYNCDIDLNSGSAAVSNVKAGSYNIEINSGDFQMDGDENFSADIYSVELNSGKAVITNMAAHGYDIDIGSGRFDYSGMSGGGTVNMGSGKGTLAYSDYFDFTELDIGSGSVDVYLPENGAVISAEIGSGSVTVNGFGINNTLHDGDEITVGSGGNTYAVDMGSGSVTFREIKDYTAPETNAISEVTMMSESEFAVTKDQLSPETPMVENVEPITAAEGMTEDDGTVGVAEVPEAPEAPEAPKAPEAPEAPEPPDITDTDGEAGITENADNAA